MGHMHGGKAKIGEGYVKEKKQFCKERFINNRKYIFG